MKANARAAKSQFERSVFEAWHVAVFGVRAYVGKLQGLDKYLNLEKPKAKAQTPDEMLAALLTMQARGTPMNIKKLH